MSESIVYCEGCHDRAFWAGWLLHLGCTDPGTPPPGRTGRVEIQDPWKTKVAGGQFAYYSATKHFIRVVPCHGKTKIYPAIRTRLQQRSTKPVTRIVVNVDSDTSVSGVPQHQAAHKPADVLNMLRTIDPHAALNGDGDIELDHGATIVYLLRWEASDPSTVGLPDQQCLERLGCAALAAAYPGREPAVGTWLSTRPNPPQQIQNSMLGPIWRDGMLNMDASHSIPTSGTIPP